MWRFVDTGIRDGPMNMAIDEAVLGHVIQGLTPPTVRLYAWGPPAVSIGYSQKAEAAVNMDCCQRDGIHVVRRLTGGRAVFHDSELTYSVVAPVHLPQVAGPVLESYRKICQPLASALNRLGADVQVAGRPARSNKASGACFEAPSWYELTVAGRKLAGSAQVRKEGVLLQHGSILLEFDAGQLAAVLKTRDEKARQELCAYLQGRACSVSQVLARKVSYGEIAAVMEEAFTAWAGGQICMTRLSSSELTMAADLREKKYRTPEWNGC